MDIAIAGAGPGGLFAAIVLARDGHAVDVFEQAPHRPETGAGIQISPNGSTLLAQVGVLAAVESMAFAPQAATLRRADTGKTVFSTPLGAAALARYGAPYLHLHRADLARSLEQDALNRGVRIHYDARIENIEDTIEQATVHTANGRAHTCDLLIGADGIHSTVRKHLFGATAPRFTQHVAWRGLVPTERLPSDLIAPDATVWAGAGRHFVHYYVRNGTLVNFAAVQERDAWAEENWQTSGDIADVRSVFDNWAPEITTLLSATTTCHLWGLFDHPPLDRWTAGRVCLLGDACHPMLPFMAQGAVMAFEDAAILARALEAHTDMQGALETYEAIRKPRTTRIQDRARRNGQLFHQKSAFRRNLTFRPMAIANRMMPSLISRQLDWIYGYDAFRVDLPRIS